MRKIARRKVQAIQEANAWIVPVLIEEQSEKKYFVEVTNSWGLPGDFKVDSKMANEADAFLLETGRSDAWTASVNGVTGIKKSNKCGVSKGDVQATLDVMVETVSCKYVIDKDWREFDCKQMVSL